MHVVDSSAWIEYFQDSERADLFAHVIEQTQSLLVPTVALYEVHKVLSRALPEHAVNDCLDVMRRGTVLALTDARAVAASKASKAHKLAFADAAMYSMAQEHKAQLWTQDVDYANLPGVQLCAKA